MAIEQAPPFNPKSFLAKVGKGRSIGKYSKNQVVFSQGDAADSVFYIQKGKVKLTVTSGQGKEAVVAILGTDEFSGEGCLAGQPRRMATATTMTECEIMRLEKKAIVLALHDKPAFSEMFIAHLLARPSASKRIWSINCSIRVRSAWHRLFYYWPILARKADPSRSLRKSARRHSRR
jgi:CRP/FNR family transcriptional regulator, cyclic AMP receptor protein